MFLSVRKFRLVSLLALAVLSATILFAQNAQRTRLILKDGSFQIVTKYRVVGDRVVFTSAERGGEEEEIPASLIDWDATKKWEKSHTQADNKQPAAKVQLDPELVKEEADRAARVPEIAPNLHLPEDLSMLALDYFHGDPELIALTQSDGALNKQTAHNILKAAINPMASSHQLVQLKGYRSNIQLHVARPVIYVRVGEDNTEAPPGAFTVNTHGNSAKPGSENGSTKSQYVIVKADVRSDVRVVSSFNTNMLGQVRQQEDVVEADSEVLPGGHWMKLTPRRDLDFGEYALLELLSDRELNLGVWDFGIHPSAPENREPIKPQERRRPSLDRRSNRDPE